MKEQLHTIPVNEAFESGDECPFCYLERQAERSALRYFAGPCASYMEPDVRAVTDEKGFCTHHMKKLYDYGNTLGSALMLQTYMASLLKEFHDQAENVEIPAKKSLFKKAKPLPEKEPYHARLQSRSDSCTLCDRVEYNMQRYFYTFFTLLKEKEFRAKVESSKGFCMRHFSRMLREAEERLPESQKEWFYSTVYALMEDNLVRVKQDLDWLIAKYDYRNASEPWGNSRDALQRAMQKLQGLYPADPIYKNE